MKETGTNKMHEFLPYKKRLQYHPVISKALEESGNKDYTIIELPKLNHFFQTCETGSIAEYAKIEETISPSVLNLITEWVLEKAVQDKPNAADTMSPAVKG